MKKTCKRLIIIPAYNEESNIIETCKTINEFVQSNNLVYDYLVINDGSTDKTENLLNKNQIPHVKLPYNMGIGSAVQTGYKYAYLNNYDIAIQFDGDGQHDISYIEEIIKPIEENIADYVIGSRFVKKSKSKFKSSKSRRIGIKLLSLIMKILNRIEIKDITSGFRAANKKTIKLFANNYPNEYPEPIAPIKALKNNLKIYEIPVEMHERNGGKSSINTWKSLYYMINVSLSMITETIGGWKHEY